MIEELAYLTGCPFACGLVPPSIQLCMTISFRLTLGYTTKTWGFFDASILDPLKHPPPSFCTSQTKCCASSPPACCFNPALFSLTLSAGTPGATVTSGTAPGPTRVKSGRPSRRLRRPLATRIKMMETWRNDGDRISAEKWRCVFLSAVWSEVLDAPFYHPACLTA